MLKILSRALHKIGRTAIASADFVNKKSTSTIVQSKVEGAGKVVLDAISEIKPLAIKIDSTKEAGIVLLIPSLIASSFFGGVATALIVAAKLAIHSQRSLTIVQTVVSGHPDKASIDSFYKRNNIDTSGLDISVLDVASRNGLRDDEKLIVNILDLFIVSAWGDAYLVNRFQLPHKFLYLIQDYEPIFYANSDRFVLAENTYHYKSYIPLCNTKLMYLNMVHNKYSVFSKFPYWFEPAVSNIKSGVSVRNVKRNMFLYGRPNVPRNLFYIVVIALDHIFNKGILDAKEWNIFMAGQDNLPIIKLTEECSITNLGKMEVEDYINFSKSIDLAIALMMAPHPNYPTLEFASIGSAVVTTKYGVKDELGFYSKNIFAANLTVESVIENIIKASEMSYEERINNLSSNNIEYDWNSALDEVVSKILPEFGQLSI
jgi:hypothetical protein